MFWIIIKKIEIFSINCKVYMLKAWHKSKIFLHVQSTQPSKVPFLLKIGEDFNIDD